VKLKLIATAIIGSVIAAAVIVPVAFAQEGGSATPTPFQRPGRFQEGQGTAPVKPGEGMGHFRGGRGEKGGMPGHSGPMGGMASGHVDIFQTAATALGMSVEDLRAQLAAGKSINDVATAAGKADAVKQAVTDALKAQITQSVTDGKLTQEKADKALADLSTKVEAMLSSTHKMGMGGGCEGKHGAPPQDGSQPTTTSKPQA